MEKIKVISLSPASVSVHMKGQKTLRQMIKDDWYSLTAKEIKKFYPQLEVECWAPEKVMKKPEEFSEGGIRYRQFPTTFSPKYGLDLSIPMLKEMKKEIRNAKEKGYEVIFHLHEYHQLHGIVIATLFKNANLIAQHHGGNCPWQYVKAKRKYYPFFLPLLVGQIWERAVLKNIKCFYALSQKELSYLKRIAPNSRIRFQTMGIEDYYFESSNKAREREKLGWPKDKKIMLFVGRLTPAKGIGYLLEAMRELKDAELKIIGWGETETYKKYIQEHKLKNVEFIGSVFGRDKLPHLSAADLMILPSLGEGAPVVLMEAIAKNLPVVASDVGGISKMIKNGREGRIIKPQNSEEIVNGVKEVLKWKRKNIKKYAEKYKWKKIIENTVKDYKKIIKERVKNA